MINQLHWLPLSARLEFKILVLVLKSKLGLASKYFAPKYLRDHICSNLSATSHQPLCSSDRQVLFVLQVRTTMSQTRFFATIMLLSLWNTLSSSLCLTLLSGSHSASLSLLKTYFYSWVFALGALLSGQTHYRELCSINLEI